MAEEIDRVVELIDAKIRELSRAKKILLEEFGNKRNALVHPLVIPSVTRKDVIVQTLKNHGPMSRVEIIAKTGIPMGTVAGILNEKTSFVSRDGKWHLIEGVEKQPEQKGGEDDG